MKRIASGIEKIVAKRCRRTVGKPPELNTYWDLVDSFWKFHAEHHRRGKDKNGHSERWHDLQRLCSLVNDKWGENHIVHWCFDPATGQPCCANEQETIEKVTTAMTEALWGHSDPVPAESRWTHTLANFKMTLVRRLFHRVGLDSFIHDFRADDDDEDDAKHAAHEDREAGENFFQVMNRVRAKKIKEYFEADENMWQLGVYVAILEVSDSALLYPLMMDPIQDDESKPGKLDILLDPEHSRVKECFRSLLALLSEWRNREVTNHPWAVLEAIKVRPKQKGTLQTVTLPKKTRVGGTNNL